MASLEVQSAGEARFLLNTLCEALSDEQSIAAVRLLVSEVVGDGSERILTKARREWRALKEDEEERPRRAARLAQKKEEKEKRVQRKRASPSPKRAKKKKRKKREAVPPPVEQVEEEEPENEAMVLDHSASNKALLLEALTAAEHSLEWRWLMSPHLEEQVRQEAQHWSEAEVETQLEEVRAQLDGLDTRVLIDGSDPLVTLPRYRRALGLMRLGIRRLRSLVGTFSGKKRALVLQLAMRPLFDVPCILPAPTTSKNKARMMLSRLQDACVEATEAARLASFARDAHMAWAWDWLGLTNPEAADTLNDWCGTTHTIGEWLKRRRRGALLLQMPALAYQTVLPLDESRMTVREVLELIRSVEELRGLNERLLSKYAAMLGQPFSSFVAPAKADSPLLLHRHGYEVLPIAVHVDQGVVA